MDREKALAPNLPDAELVEVGGYTVFLMTPAAPRSGDRPWVWYAPTILPHLPDEHMGWLFERFLAEGLAVAGVDVGESYGSPAGTAGYHKAYAWLTGERGLSKKAALLPRSRGGLMLYNWAARHPEAVTCIAGIYPVCDLSSYPRLEKASPAYGMTVDELRRELHKYNPVELLEPLAAARVPLWHIHGDQDELVPLEPNSLELIARYRNLGGPGELVVAEGQGHNLWDGFFKSEDLVAFVLQHVDGQA
jgi:pimeloyl-ACP methyl ester carboxylesterase